MFQAIDFRNNKIVLYMLSKAQGPDHERILSTLRVHSECETGLRRSRNWIWRLEHKFLSKKWECAQLSTLWDRVSEYPYHEPETETVLIQKWAKNPSLVRTRLSTVSQWKLYRKCRFILDLIVEISFDMRLSTTYCDLHVCPSLVVSAAWPKVTCMTVC